MKNQLKCPLSTIPKMMTKPLSPQELKKVDPREQQDKVTNHLSLIELLQMIAAEKRGRTVWFTTLMVTLAVRYVLFDSIV